MVDSNGSQMGLVKKMESSSWTMVHAVENPISCWELAEPSIRDAFGLCVQQGAVRVIVSPFFLFPGRHWYQDIPLLTADAAKYHPGVLYIITAPLGLHKLLVDVVNDRIKHCLNHVAGDADEFAACAGTSRCKLY
ncbi:sirohydrochlorin ferrochelatase, chloroplastic-like [Durio zibethinus]|uniref:Sirohydrochlorin ferrochelatase, chloroplastic-like n=1 Tax=Durio zibethinus TaxID=66656 RepID=A0A6P5ZDY0_DURZI|nr:sirohydrochlorin ferrochelatase, chloroplastic-like [Durio zibethinus]